MGSYIGQQSRMMPGSLCNRPPWHYNLAAQHRCQALCSLCALTLTTVLFSLSFLHPHHSVSSGWRSATVGVTGVGVILDIFGLWGLYSGLTIMLSAMLLYNVMVLMTFEVFYLVFAFTGGSSKRTLFPVEIGLTAALILVSFTQLYSGIYFFRLARIRRAFDQVLSSNPEVSTGALLPADLLIDVMKALGQKPTVTEMSELSGDIETDLLEFDNVCSLQARYAAIVVRRARNRRGGRRATGAWGPLTAGSSVMEPLLKRNG